MQVRGHPPHIANISFRDPEELPPPFVAEIVEAGVSHNHVILLAIIITSPPIGPEKTLDRWAATPVWIRRVAAAIAVDMAAQMILEAEDVAWFDMDWLSELVKLIFEHPGGLSKNSKKYKRLDLEYKQLVDHLVQRLGPRESWEPANPVDQVLLAVKNLKISLSNRASSHYAKSAAKWALRALANVGHPSRRWQLESDVEAFEIQEVKNRVHIWIDRWWSETLEVLS